MTPHPAKIRKAKVRPPLTLQAFWFILKETVREWNDDKVPRLGAALAFYAILSLGPLLLIVVAFGGLAFGRAAVEGYIFEEINKLIGNEGAQAVQTILANTSNPKANIIASIIGFVTLVVSATSFFAQLQDALNAIWNIEERENAHWTWFIHKRLLSFAMIAGGGIILLIGLVISAIMPAVTSAFGNMVPLSFAVHFLHNLVSFVIITLVFAMIFKVLPDVHIQWRDTWIGAAITAVLFAFGKLLIGTYLAHSAFTSTYGAAGSLIVVLVWIYYSTQIFFLGAEFTQVYSRYMGAQIILKKGRRKAPAHVTATDNANAADNAEVVNMAKTEPQAAKPEL
ncbi:YihY/virulence factor BrkB family protein [Asticcacaulis biprosthecium]|uniref:YihY/virulence factor BrkB family protein n=1 Tax=Asticcacaulis biprosthecium TaxID=76891 RepID=UPI0002ED773F|nr:YihY/virulence factor BrkB family protein [Asticcacaulis biprosthecium]